MRPREGEPAARDQRVQLSRRAVRRSKITALGWKVVVVVVVVVVLVVVEGEVGGEVIVETGLILGGGRGGRMRLCTEGCVLEMILVLLMHRIFTV